MDPQRIVIKFGTSTLTGGNSNLSQPQILDLVRQVSTLQRSGCEVILVSSGAMAAGRAALNYPDLPKHVPSKQMLAAVGQPKLMSLYEMFFDIYGLSIAQVLLTRNDLLDRRRFLNARNTVEALLSEKVIPIINENDTVATEEIRFGDNDNLSAQVANMAEADLLILLTDQPGLFTRDPRQHPDARLISLVEPPDIPDEVWEAAGGTSTGLGTGGMLTKLQAADLARRSGTRVVIAHGAEPDILVRICQGEAVGTTLLPATDRLESRKRFLLTGIRANGALQVDSGAVQALLAGGSLLPVGIIELKGEFERGDTVRVTDKSGKKVAIGLVNYSSRDLCRLCRKQSTQIESILGYTFGDEAIHHNNIFLFSHKGGRS
ncbi:MAG: glutamate 5-kinase [Anaerolineaceae bacterium]|nr:glutamate 5-kinase [Anaerolineaceae bacterium]